MPLVLVFALRHAHEAPVVPVCCILAIVSAILLRRMAMFLEFIATFFEIRRERSQVGGVCVALRLQYTLF